MGGARVMRGGSHGSTVPAGPARQSTCPPAATGPPVGWNHA
ncbi:hypothetical protein ACFFX0_09140 [Citricoccus parietis]|uniref:Uncharacterized protein n=1 Tax=Citricoccus parietis TaxID=592307 RepID=A0ABV5FXJ0_9MICC